MQSSEIKTSYGNGVELDHGIRFGFTHNGIFANVPVATDYGARILKAAAAAAAAAEVRQ